MAHSSLYRRYRPDTFEGVIGQDHIVRTLKNQIKSDTVGHAYLFTGTRGTGKTSVAKIFARAVNCEHPIDGSPCGKCEACLELALSGNFDILELDAASNNSVDQIRELTDKIGFPPTIGRYKVYIIDEVHMLSKSAYNALLKTLEEPPSHAIFILATTEVHQIPATILSRCLRFDFRLVPSSKIAERLRYIFDDCKVSYEPQAVELISNAGQGSVRDALSIADMCISYSSGNVTYNSVLEVLGASDPEKLVELARFIADGNLEGALNAVSKMCYLGKSIPILASDIAALFRDVLYIKTCETAKEMLCIPDNVYSKYSELAKKYGVGKCMNIMKIMNSLEGEFHYSTQHRILFEAALVSAALGSIESADNGKINELESKIKQLDQKIITLSKGGFSPAPVVKDARQVWKGVASELENRGFRFLALAAVEAEIECNDDEFTASVSNAATYDLLTQKNNRDVINEIFYTLCDLKLVIKEQMRLNDDKALPYIKNLFGKYLEIK